MQLHDLTLEQRFLSALIKYPQEYLGVQQFFSEDDIYSKDSVLHRTIFSLIKQSVEKGEDVEATILSQRALNLGIKFEEELPVGDYIISLSQRNVAAGSVEKFAKELKKMSATRKVIKSCEDAIKEVKALPPSSSLSEILDTADKKINEQISVFDTGENNPSNIYDDIEYVIESAGENKSEQLLGPFPKMNEIYGSVLKGGNICTITSRSGVGKAQNINCKIYTPNGPQKIGDVKVGDLVMSPDGTEKKVIGVFPQGVISSYKVTMTDGSATYCSEDHLWAVKNKWDRRLKKPFRVKTLGEIIKNYLLAPDKNRKFPSPNYSIPITKPVKFTKKELPIHPYLMGCLLGDGCFSRGDKILFTSADIEIVDRLQTMTLNGDELTAKSQKFQYGFVKKDKTKKVKCPFFLNHRTRIANEINKMGISHCKAATKFIPESYKYSSVEDRIELLRGILDTDGTANKESSGGRFCSTSICLVNDVIELIRSLGGRANPIRQSEIRGIGKNILFNVNFNFDNGIIPFHLKRKIELWKESKRSKVVRYIQNIEKVEDAEAVCIKIDSEDELYLTDDFIVTHNTSLAMDFCCFVGDKYDVPVLHLDNGEMSKEELQFRRCSAMTGVPHHLLESGDWKKAGEEITTKVRTAIRKMKEGKSKFFYYCVAGMTVDEMVGFSRKFYYNHVGRGKRMILSFDYIKTTNQLGGNMTEWQVVGEIVDKFKKFVQKDILFEGNPMIGMFTSVQSNRLGVTTNKTSDKIVDDESTVSLSDRIIQFCSHMFILRKKTMDEILEDGQEFGTHKLICIKARHLGKDVAGHLEPVKVGDQLRNNFINLSFKNFAIKECGDLREIARKKQSQASPKTNTDDEPIGF